MADSRKGKGLKAEKVGGHEVRSAETQEAVHLVPAAPHLLQTSPHQAGDAAILEVIEAEIIPRLFLVHSSEQEPTLQCKDCRLPPSPDEVQAFGELVVRQDLDAALSFVRSLCQQGLSLESVLLTLVAPAARWLGEKWLEDHLSFMDVSRGLGTLQQLVQIVGPQEAPSGGHRGLAVLLAAPGEQHTLGLYLVGEFLRRAGFGVHLEPYMPEFELLHLVRCNAVTLVGISVSNTQLLPALSRLICALRKAAPALPVMLGGATDLADFAQQHQSVVCGTDHSAVLRYLDSLTHPAAQSH